MARLLIRGTNEPINLTDAQAKIIQRDWVNGSLPSVVGIGTMSLKSSEIKAIIMDEGEAGAETKRVHELTTDELKVLATYQFEQECKANENGQLIRSEALGIEDEGVTIWLKKLGHITEDGTAIRPSYVQWRRQYEALCELRHRREYAKKMDSNTLFDNAESENALEEKAWRRGWVRVVKEAMRINPMAYKAPCVRVIIERISIAPEEVGLTDDAW